MKKVLPIQSKPAASVRRILGMSVICCLSFLVGTSSVNSEMVDVDTAQLGGFYPAGTPDNTFDFQNYFIGHGTTPGFPTTLERRSFFIFDLPTLSAPVESATFTVYLPTPGGIVANFTGGFEEMVITSTPFSSVEILSDSLTDPEIDTIFSTFGESEFFGSVGIAEGETFTEPLTPLEISLSPAALAMINDSLGGEFIITGRMFTYDPAPGTLDELMFGLTDVVVGGSPGPVPSPFLTLVTVPEPGSGLLFLGVASVAALRRRAN